MAITKAPGRQEVVCARVTGTFGTGNDVAATGTYAAIDVPTGAVVVGGHLVISDATTATVDVHVGDGGVDNRYANNVDGAATGLTALVPTGYVYPAKDTIDIMIDTAAPEAAGAFELVVLYVVDGRVAFSQG
jgi:hypothetical protein